MRSPADRATASHQDRGARPATARSSVWLVLAVILLFALVIRAYGTNYGLPYVYHPDEPAIVERALQIERSSDLNPHWFNYPTLYIYAQTLLIVILRPIVRAWAGWRGITLDLLAWQGIIYQAGRLLTALIGTATVAVVYGIGRRLFNRRVGLWAAFILATTALHIEHSHYITTDVPAAFFVALCLYFAARALEDHPLRYLMLSALMAGFAAGAKYNAGLVLVTTGVAFLATRRSWKELVDPALILVPLAALGGFLLSTPYALLDYDTFNKGVQAEIEHYRTGHQGAEGSDNWRWFALYLYGEGMGHVLAAVTAASVLFALIRRTRRDLLLLLFPLLYYWLISAQRVRFARNMMPLLPFLAVLAARLVYAVLRDMAAHIPWAHLRRPLPALMRGAAVLAVAVLLVSGPVRQQIRYDILLTQPDTRTIAKMWIEENIPTGARIAFEEYTPPLQFSWMPGTTTKRYRADKYWRLSERPLDYYRQKPYDYVVVSSFMYGRYFVDRVSYPQDRRFYETLFTQWTLVKEFTGPSAPMHNPVVRIYKVPR